MKTLLLRLVGPMQSWGTQSQFRERDTGLEPSKSGVIGLLCAALGRPRDEPVNDLAALMMGVRVEREGAMRRDYQTAGGWHRREDAWYGVAKADGKTGGTVLSDRYYLADADFLVGLSGEDEALLTRLHAALGAPHWPLALGRKAFVPAIPVQVPDNAAHYGPALRDGEVRTLLCDLNAVPWCAGRGGRDVQPAQLRLVFDATTDDLTQATGLIARRADVPVSFALGQRTFRTRFVRTAFTPHTLPASPASPSSPLPEGEADVPVTSAL